MKKARLLLVALMFATMAGGMLGASASHCGSGTGKPHDPFGSCEGDQGMQCGSGLQGIAPVMVDEGVQACATAAGAPAGARAGVWTAPDGRIVVFADGDDATAAGAAAGWARIDVAQDAETCKARVRHGESGSWANAYPETGDTDSATDTDDCPA